MRSSGFFLAMINGLPWPPFGILFGELSYSVGQGTDVGDKTRIIALKMFLVGLGAILTASIWNFIFPLTSGRRSDHGIRRNLFSSVVHRDMSWFESDENGSRTARIVTQ